MLQLDKLYLKVVENWECLPQSIQHLTALCVEENNLLQQWRALSLLQCCMFLSPSLLFGDTFYLLFQISITSSPKRLRRKIFVFNPLVLFMFRCFIT